MLSGISMCSTYIGSTTIKRDSINPFADSAYTYASPGYKAVINPFWSIVITDSSDTLHLIVLSEVFSGSTVALMIADSPHLRVVFSRESMIFSATTSPGRSSIIFVKFFHTSALRYLSIVPAGTCRTQLE